MREVILVKVGEIVLKGLNKHTFEAVLLRNIKHCIAKFGRFEVKYAQSTISITPQEEVDIDEVLSSMGKVFGIASLAKACVAEKNMESIMNAACEYLDERLTQATTFKVEAKRSDKKFSLKSPEISATLGEFILNKYPHLRVDVHNPEIVVTVEIRDYGAYIRGNANKGAGGLPVGTGGKVAVLISGGIDSPVASWMMAKRGVELVAIHFASPPYTSERAEKKVVALLEKVAQYAGDIKMYTVLFTKIQEAIHEQCPEELFTIIMRRAMFKLANIIAQKNGCAALVTGESLGQVASQTLGAIYCVDEAAEMPVFRPLVGMDKGEIVEIARAIDTFDISIQPYEDCCTVFTPKHPRTKPVLENVLEAEAKVDFSEMIENAEYRMRIVK